MASRKLQSQTPKISAPTSLREWNQLCDLAIEAAQLAEDPRVVQLRDSRATGQSEKILRKMGIIHIPDISREFPSR